jgi:hypothetical protein
MSAVCKRISDMTISQEGYIHCMSSASSLTVNPPGTKVCMIDILYHRSSGTIPPEFKVRFNTKDTVLNFRDVSSILVCRKLDEVNDMDYVIGW